MQENIPTKEIIRHRNRRLAMLSTIMLAATLITFAYWWFAHKNWVSTNDAYVAGHLINIKAQVQGIVIEINAENTQKVEQGQVLVKLDGKKAKIQLEYAKAALAEAVRNVLKLKSKLSSLQHRLSIKNSELHKVKKDLEQFAAVEKEGSFLEKQVETANARVQLLLNEIAEISAEKKSIEVQIEDISIRDHPLVEKAKNQLRKAFLEYERRNVLAPVSGYIAKRNVEVGDLVKVGSPLMVIVPLRDLWVEANFLETKIAKIRPGQPAEIKVNAYGDDFIYHGTVSGINPGTGNTFALIPRDNAAGNFIHITERIPVRIALDPKEIKRKPLQPGLSTVTRIKTSDDESSIFNSKVNATGNLYRTDVYKDELDRAEKIIEKIMAAHIPE